MLNLGTVLAIFFQKEETFHAKLSKADKFFETDWHKKAFDILDHALQVYPRNPDLLVEIGRKKLKSGDDIREADKYISRAIQIDPS